MSKRKGTSILAIGQFVLIMLLALVLGMSACAKGPASVERIEITAYTGSLGSSLYALGVGYGELVNKYSTRLHISTIETKNMTEAISTVTRLSPEKQKYIVAFASPQDLYQAAKGDPPYDVPFNNARYIGQCFDGPNTPFTCNPNIKTPKDLIGKKVSFGPTGSILPESWTHIMKFGYGITPDQYRLEHVWGEAATDALINGTVDVASGGTTAIGGTTEWANWVPNSALERLLVAKATYAIEWSVDAFTKAREATHIPIAPTKMAGLNIGKSNVSRGLGLSVSIGWWVSKDMPNDIVTELVTILYDHAGEFEVYHAAGKAVTKDALSLITTPNGRKDYHPAAAEFYAKKGNKFFGE